MSQNKKAKASVFMTSIIIAKSILGVGILGLVILLFI
jgi:hypothetical protein